LMIYYDSFVASFSRNNINFSRFKHIDIKSLFVRKRICEPYICVEHIAIESMIADPLNKGYLQNPFKSCWYEIQIF
jgi:phosphoribulokinase